jgi:hypothetical protein
LPIYLNWQIQLREINALVSQLSVCIRSLRDSYGILDSYINLEKPGNEMPIELLKLNTDYFYLLATINKFSEAKERVFKISY